METKTYHWYTSSGLNWAASNSLTKCLNRQRRFDREASLKPVGCNVWKVPGDCKTTNYKIDNYKPVIEGVEFVGFETY